MTTTTAEIKVIQRAKFFPSGRYFAPSDGLAQEGFKNSENCVIVPAELEFNGIRLFSAVPQSAAEAERINRAIGG